MKQINNKENKYIYTESFLQSPEWEEFQKSLGRKTFRVGEKLLIKMPLTMGQSYLYCPRSICRHKDIDMYMGKIKKLAQSEGSFFARIEPMFIDKEVDPKDIGVKKVQSRQPKQTLMVDLEKDEEEILSGMKSKTRYNIRLARKKGVKISKSTKLDDVGKFYDIVLETAKRDGIKVYDKDYYRKMAKVFLKSNKFAIYMAKYNGEVIAVNLMLYYGKIAYYLHGASSNKYRNMMAPYMLQWEAIKDAKKLGYKLYDFWGISPLKREITNDTCLDSEVDSRRKLQISNKSKIRNSNNQNKMRDSKFQISNNNHPWYGISRFKLGFAPNTKTGVYVEYPGCFEISYGKKRYMLYSMFKKAF